jgi:hypothetical protein
MEPNDRPASVARALSLSWDPRHLISFGLWRPFSSLHGRFTAPSLIGTLQQAGFVDCDAQEIMAGFGLLASATAPVADG